MAKKRSINTESASANGNGQDKQPIFDFHFHLLFKSFIKKFENQYPTQRSVDDLKEEFDIDHFFWDKVDEWFLHFLDSQASFKQIEEGNVVSGYVSISPMERMFASKKGIGGKLLNDQVVTHPMDPDYLEAIRNGEISYYQLFLRELNTYKLLHDAGAINFHSRSPKNKTNGDTKYTFAICMEGGHALLRSKIGRPGVEDDLPQGTDDTLMADFRANPLLPMDESLENLQKAMWAEGMDLQYLVLTHLSQIPGQETANHAYGAKFLKSELKYPVGMGLTEEGKRLIDTAYHLIFKLDKNDDIVENVGDVDELLKTKKVKDARVLIDIKHMSLKAREDFYAYRRMLEERDRNNLSSRKAKNTSENQQRQLLPPIVASHVGVTGYFRSEWINALEKAEKGNANVPVVKVRTEAREAGHWGKVPRKFHFNPWSINLMDDDIIEIAKSRGLIGISLDARILGFVSRTQNMVSQGVYEYLSIEEFRNYFPYENVKGLPLESMEVGLESELFPNKYESHMLVFCFNILHIVSVIENFVYPGQKKAWDFVCLGSDFDGLIDPLKNVRDASKFGNLKGELKKWLPIAYKSYEESNGGLKEIEESVQGAALDENIQKFLYLNGNKFVGSWMGGAPVKQKQTV